MLPAARSEKGCDGDEEGCSTCHGAEYKDAFLAAE